MTTITATPAQIEALADVMDDMLTDMGISGRSVCEYVKAKARIAYEPFRDPEDTGEFMMPLDVARQIVESVNSEGE